MKYHIHLNYKNGGSYTALKVDKDLFEKLKESIVNNDYDYAPDLWWDCEGEDYGACGEPYRNWCWVDDSLDCKITDDNNKIVCIMQHIESRQMPDSESKQVHRYGDGLWFELAYTHKRDCEKGWVFSLELDNEEFDPNKLYFKEHCEDIFKDCLYIDTLSYEGCKIELEEDDSAGDDDGEIIELSEDAYLIAIKGDKIKRIEIDSIDELEKVKNLVVGDLNEQTGNEMMSNPENCDIFWEEEKSFVEGERPTNLEECKMFKEGLAAVKKNGKWGFIDKTGKIVFPIEYDWVRSFSEGLAAVEKNRKWGFVDKTGKVVVPMEYDEVWDLREGLVTVMKWGMWGFVDNTGKVIVPVEYDSVKFFSEGLATVEKDGKWGFVDTTGKIVVPVEYDFVKDFSEGLAGVEKNDKWGFVDKIGKVEVLVKYDEVWSFREGLAGVKKNDKCGFVDETGKIVVPVEYESVEDFREGLAKVNKGGERGKIGTVKGGKWGFVDQTGKVVVSVEYDSVKDFREGLAVVEKDGKFGLIDKTGKVVVMVEYDSIKDF